MVASHGTRALAIIGGANALIAGVSFGIAAAGPQLSDGLGLDAQQLGFMLATMPAGLMLGTFGWGVAADRIGERRTLVSSWAAVVVALALAAAVGTHAWGSDAGARELVLLGAAFLITGAAGSSAHSAGGRAITEAFPERLHGRVLSIRHTFIPLGGTLGGLGIPALLHHSGLGEVLAASAAIALLVTAGMAFVLPGSDGHNALLADDSTVAPALGPSPLTRSDLWLLVGSCSLFALVQLGLVSFLTSFLVHEADHSVRTAAIIFSAAQLLGAFGRVTLGTISDRVGNPVVVLRRLALWGCALSVAALVTPVHVEGYVLALMLLVFTSWNGVAVAAAARMAPLGRMGATLGMQTTANAGMGVVAPIAVGAMLQNAGWALVELAALGTFVVAAAGLVALGRRTRSEHEPAAAR